MSEELKILQLNCGYKRNDFQRNHFLQKPLTVTEFFLHCKTYFTVKENYLYMYGLDEKWSQKQTTHRSMFNVGNRRFALRASSVFTIQAKN